ncbi:unnamed protein product [Didymodactylos carnosus]|uniref:Uncharacterized protein n=1 Tax=Didymodactylos carnosus TaxID=1234261 RepID=A0A816GDU0_9BILA|nr:unnamed protein product [Didymodactylos carnosus]CAF1672364.1 unnamed protein product [Didymodactylos carnosus]CAF4218746.1 unnamed protein product [Didymodactylos carnosus]CAF4650176.1 unnamed protein product [Didymodactylos carnosus]
MANAVIDTTLSSSTSEIINQQLGNKEPNAIYHDLIARGQAVSSKHVFNSVTLSKLHSPSITLPRNLGVYSSSIKPYPLTLISIQPFACIDGSFLR